MMLKAVGLDRHETFPGAHPRILMKLAPRKPEDVFSLLKGTSMGSDWEMAARKRPLAFGDERRARIEVAPADWPKSVTFVGSPPKAAILSRTHSSAMIQSRS